MVSSSPKNSTAQHKLEVQPRATKLCIWSGELSATWVHNDGIQKNRVKRATFARIGNDKQAFFLNFQSIFSEMNQRESHDVTCQQLLNLRFRSGRDV